MLSSGAADIDQILLIPGAVAWLIVLRGPCCLRQQIDVEGEIPNTDKSDDAVVISYQAAVPGIGLQYSSISI